MKRFLPIFLLALTATSAKSQPSQQVFISDIDNFRTAYDSVQTTTDSIKQANGDLGYFMGYWNSPDIIEDGRTNMAKKR